MSFSRLRFAAQGLAAVLRQDFYMVIQGTYRDIRWVLRIHFSKEPAFLEFPVIGFTADRSLEWWSFFSELWVLFWNCRVKALAFGDVIRARLFRGIREGLGINVLTF